MKRLIIILIIVTSVVGCKRGPHQVILLKNSSADTIYYILSEDSTLTNLREIADVRPITSQSLSSFEKELKNINTKNQQEDSLERYKNALYRYRIGKGEVVVLISSESAEIFVDATSIQNIIKHRYNGKANVFIIRGDDLEKFTDNEIADQKNLPFLSLKEENISGDSLMLEYSDLK